MVTIDEIDSEKTLKEWLGSLPSGTAAEQIEARRITVSLAARSALRALPVYWKWVTERMGKGKRDLTLLPSLRCGLVSSVAMSYPLNRAARLAADAAAMNSDHKAAVSVSTGEYSRYTACSATASHAAYAAASSAATTNGATDEASTAAMAYEAAFQIVSNSDAWGNLRADLRVLATGKSTSNLPLWPQDIPIQKQWDDIKALLTAPDQAGTWDFWLWWYEGVLTGTAPAGDSALMIEIATSDKIDWNDEPAALKEIDAIWKRHGVQSVIDENPLGQGIYRNEAGRLVSEPICQVALDDIVDDVRRALTEFNRRCKKAGGNLGPYIATACEPIIKEMRQRLPKLKDNPRELLRLLEESRIRLTALARQDEFKGDGNLEVLLHNIAQREDAVCVAAPDVMEEVRQRMANRAERFTYEQRRAAMHMGAGMVADSDGMLRFAMARAMLVVMDDSCSPEEISSAWTFMLGALPRGAQAMQASGDDGANPSVDRSYLDTLKKVSDGLTSADKIGDVAQEAVEEAGPWVTEVFTQIYSGNFWGWSWG